ncbi:MAG TPA: MFS transporter [Galbitalea sp.]|jgi:MFS family permease|nr:MFS transporter [Galbitalea sp.]
MIRTFRSLGIFNYRIFFFGAFISNIGTWMQRTAQDWIVLTKLTNHDAAAVGITLALQFGPVLLLMPLSGLIADRVNRRRMLIATQLAMGVLGLGLGFIVLANVATLWEVYAFAFALGAVSAIDAPIRQTFVSELVPEKSIPNAVALNSASFNGARLIGPAVAGLMIAAVGSGWVFLSNAASFGAMLAALAIIRVGELNTHAKSQRKGGQIREGWHYVGSRPDIIVVLVMLFLVGTFGMNFAIFNSTMALAFHRGADGYGILSSVMAIGSVLGALMAARRDKPRVIVIGLASLGFGISMIASALMPSYWTFGAVLIAVGLTALTMITSANAYVQTTTAPNMRGRVMALYMAIFAGTTPLGSPLVGWIANIAGPRWAIAVGAASGFAAAGVALAWMVFANHLRVRRNAGARFGLSVSYDHATQIRRKRPTPEDLSTTEIAIQRG